MRLSSALEMTATDCLGKTRINTDFSNNIKSKIRFYQCSIHVICVPFNLITAVDVATVFCRAVYQSYFRIKLSFLPDFFQSL